MKQTKTKLLCLLLAALMLLSSLTACGKDKAKDSNLIKLGDYELLYKGACIMEDSDGNDAIVLTLDLSLIHIFTPASMRVLERHYIFPMYLKLMS